MQVLVGIPDSNATRTGGPISNATLGYIHEFGAPEASGPPRPFLIPGVEASLGDVEPYLGDAAEAALEGRSRTP